MDRYIGNRGGIPFVDATQTNAGSTTTNAVYSLPDHTFRNLGAAGLMVISFTTASADTVTGVTIQVNNQTLALTDSAGGAITGVAAGDLLVAFNKIKNTLREI